MLRQLSPPNLNSPEYQALLQQCIHCGLCLQACPTYSVFGTETDSPRGRISLMQAASQGQIEFGGAFEKHIDLCLGCRACETACPSGVQYGLLVEQARISVEQVLPPSSFERLIHWLTLKQLLPKINRLRWIARFLRLYQRLGLSRLVRKLNFLPGPLRTMEGMLPNLPKQYRDHRVPAPAFGEKHGTVAFFHGCVQEAFLAEVNEATLRVLQRNGYEVHFPTLQTCCGAAALHIGEEHHSKQLARQNIDAFLDYKQADFVAIINNAGGCGATLKEYVHLLKDDPEYQEKAQQFSTKVKDISEFLVEHMTIAPQGVVDRRVTYSDSCHLRHAQKVVKQPRDLLRMIPGLELVELEKPDRCCGSAGIYNILQWETANAILAEKMADIDQTDAETVVTTNTGCYMQLVYGASDLEKPLQVVHLVNLLDESYRIADQYPHPAQPAD
jgi:glycolate oxidase iron-sulfur subunit